MLHRSGSWKRHDKQQSKERRDRGGKPRDYYRVEDEAGHRFWLFRHGLHDSGKPAPDWYLHGLFA